MLSSRLRRLRSSAILLLMLLVTGCGGSALSARTAVSADAVVEGQLPAGTTSSAGIAPPAGSGAAPTARPTRDPSTGGFLGPVASHSDHPAGPVTAAPPVVGQPAPADGGGRVSCAGFHNQTGVTGDTVTVANVSDLSGPVPGIFSSAQQAVRAYVAYFNATSNLCGRKLSVLGIDSRTDALGDEAGYQKACERAFAAVGSMAAFDSGGAQTAQGCGLPDIRSQSVSDARNNCTTCFGAQATQTRAFQNAVPDFFLAHDRAAALKSAMLYVNEAASVDNAVNTQKAEEMRGMRFVYSGAFDVAAFNYGPYVQQLKSKGARLVEFVGSADEAVRMARAMQDVSYRPDVFLLDPTGYTPAYAGAGDAVEGTYVYINFTPFEESAKNAELRLYEQWLQQVSPGAAPTYFGLYAWSAARLFAEQAAALGGRLTRGHLVERLRTVHNWTSNGIHAPQNVGGKTNGNCWRFLQLRGGVWHPVGGTSYLCHGATIVP